MQLYRVTTNWDESSVTWNQASTGQSWSTPGGDYDLPLGEVPFVTGLDHEFYPPVDITDIVQKWLRGKTDNQGVMLINLSSNETNLKASEYSGNSTYLDITYTDPCPCDVSADVNYDCIVDLKDYAEMAHFWLTAEKCVDIAPTPGDGIVNVSDLREFTRQWGQPCP